MNNNEFWPRGHRKILAKAARISGPYFSDILVRRRGVGPLVAARLAKASKKVLGVAIPETIWQHNKTSTHPVFTNVPR